MESHDSGADQHRNTQEKNGDRAGRHRLTVRATADTRTGSTALRWIGADRTQQGGAYKRDQAGTGRLGTLCQKERGKARQQTAKRAGAGSTRKPQADKAVMLPLCLKRHGTTGRSVSGRGEDNHRREGRETLSHRRKGTGEDRPEGIQGTTWLL